MERKYTTKFTRIVALGLVAATLFAGCGKSDKASGEGDAPQAVSSNFNAEGLPILNEKETFTIAVVQGSPIKAAAEKACVKEAEEATNVHIEWMEIPLSGWDEKINVMFSTGNLPDAILGDMNLSRDYEQVVALDEYLDLYAPNVTAFFESRDDYPAALYAPDGKIKCLPTGDESTHNIIDTQYWINKVWLDKLGLEVPETTEELREVLIAFRDNDPNGNGQKDEIPFTFGSAWGWANAVDNFFGPFGVVESGYHVFIDENDKVVFAAEEQGYYDALSYLNSLYADGLIDKDVFTMSSDQYNSKDPDGTKIGLLAGYGPDGCGFNGELGSYVVLPVLKGPDGKQMIGMNNVTRTGGFAITTSCKNPAALVRWYDYVNSSLELALEWGRGARDVIWDIVEKDGKEVPMFLTMDEAVLEANGGYKNKPEYRNAESFSGYTPALWRFEYDQALVYDDKWPVDLKLNAVRDQLQYGVTYLPSGTASLENSERRALLKVDIDTYLKKFIADSVINGIDDAKWETHQKTLEKLKVDEYRDLCQEFVDSLAQK